MNEEREPESGEAERDERGTVPPSEQGEAEPTPGEDPGPFGNPGQDEEALSERQQEAAREGRADDEDESSGED